MPQGFPDALRRPLSGSREKYQSQLRLFDDEHQVAPGVVVRRTGGHTPGHKRVRIAAGSDALTFAGDAVFTVGSINPAGTTAFEHDPEEAARVRVRLLRQLAETGELLVALTCRSIHWPC